MAFQRARRTRNVMLVVPVRPESGFEGRTAWPGFPLADQEYVLVVLLWLVDIPRSRDTLPGDIRLNERRCPGT